MDRAYPSRINWENEPSISTPINDTNLNKMDSALYTIDGRVIDLDNNKVGKTETFNTSRNGVVPKPTQADITNEKVLRADGVWVEQSGGGGGGGGHTIVNNAGTSLQQRGKLQTVGGLNAIDDGANNTTEITDEYEIIPWATWQSYSDAQKAQHPNAIVTGAPDCDGTLEIENLHEAWSNPDPTQDFDSQTVPLDLSGYGTDYDYYRVESSVGSRSATVDIPKGYGGSLSIAGSSGASNTINYIREFNYESETSISFGNAVTQNANGNRTTTNGLFIPLKIYVYKKKLTAKIKAIAHDVSTSASKCMMSDEQTSVEDVLNATTANTKQSLGNISTYTPTKDGYLKVATNNSTSNAFVYIADATSGMVLAVCTGFNANTGCFCSTQVKKNKQYNFYSNASATISAEFLPIE